MRWRLQLSVLMAVCALSVLLVSGANAQTNDPGTAQLAQDQDRAAKLAIAESIIADQEAASGRAFDPGFRANALNKLASRTFDELASIQAAGGGLGIQAYADSGLDLVFVPITPCRVFDTRVTFGGTGPIPAGTTRNFSVTSPDAPCPDVPFGPATAVAINFVAVNPAGKGNLRVTPFGTPMPAASVINYFNVNIANGIDIKICNPAVTVCAFDITIQADVSATDVLADVFGYFQLLPPAGRATAVVERFPAVAFDSARTRNFLSVFRPLTGVYCLKPVASIDQTTSPAYVTVEWANSSISSGFNYKAFHVKGGAGCVAGDFRVLTYDFSASPFGVLSNDVSFEVFIP